MVVYLAEYGRDDPALVGVYDSPEAAMAACLAHKNFAWDGRYGDFVVRVIEMGEVGEVGHLSFGVWHGREIVKAGKVGEFLAEYSDPEWAAQPYW